MIKKYLTLMLLSFVGVVFGETMKKTSFIIKQQTTEKMGALSKDAIKERMGEAVRESMHALLDTAASVVQTQLIGATPLATTCALHQKIIVLQRKLSRVAESLIDSHFVYKKNHKLRLEKSLALLRTCAFECKAAGDQLQAKANKESQKYIETLTTKFASLEAKLSTDICLKTI
jgi:hypothetical protein